MVFNIWVVMVTPIAQYSCGDVTVDCMFASLLTPPHQIYSVGRQTSLSLESI